jgi:hypothetical protein
VAEVVVEVAEMMMMIHRRRLLHWNYQRAHRQVRRVQVPDLKQMLS